MFNVGKEHAQQSAKQRLFLSLGTRTVTKAGEGYRKGPRKSTIQLIRPCRTSISTFTRMRSFHGHGICLFLHLTFAQAGGALSVALLIMSKHCSTNLPKP